MTDLIDKKSWDIFSKRFSLISFNNNYYTDFITNFIEKENIDYDGYKKNYKNDNQKKETINVLINIKNLEQDTISIIMSFVFDNPKSYIKNIIEKYSIYYSEFRSESRLLLLRFRKCENLIEEEMDEMYNYEEDIKNRIIFLENEYIFFNKIKY